MGRAALIALGAAVALAGCRKKAEAPSAAPPPELTGLAAVPATAEMVVGVDPGRLAGSPVVARAMETLLAREPELAARWQVLRQSCQIDLDRIQRLMIALGPPPPGGRIGTGPLVLIGTGKISEADLVKCVREMVGKGGGSLTFKDHEGRTLYQVKDGARAMYIAFGRADTVVLGNQEAYVVEAVGSGKKALDNPELAGWLKQADQKAPVWIAGRVADRLRAGLVRASSGTLKAGARAFLGAFDPTDGLKAEVVALMESPEDAKRLESLVKMNLVGLSWAAQVAALAPVVQKVAIQAQGASVRITAPLTMEDVNRVLDALDGDKAPAQDSPPRGGSASASPP